MIGIVGVGPRTGTSFMMSTLRHHGFPVIGEEQVPGWTAPANNPDGHFELDPETLVEGLLESRFEDKVLKIWPPALHLAQGLDRIVVLERQNKLAQAVSIERCLKHESESIGIQTDINPDDVIDLHTQALNAWLDTDPGVPAFHVFTEELDDRLDDVIAFLGGSTWQS